MKDPFKEIKDSNLNENTKKLLINKLENIEEMYAQTRICLERDINSLLEVAIVNEKQLHAIHKQIIKILDEYMPISE